MKNCRLIFCLAIFLTAFVLLSAAGSQYAEAAEKGSLQVLSNPEGSDVFIDDVLAGRTPFTKNDCTPGEYRIEVRRAGKNLGKTVTVREGYMETVSFRFSDEIRIGWLIEDSFADDDSSGGSYSVIAFDLASSDKNVVFVPVFKEDFRELKLDGIKKKYNLDYFISLKYQTEYGASKETALVLNTYVYDYFRKKNIFERKYTHTRSLSSKPRPSEIDPFRKRAYQDFAADVDSTVQKVTTSITSDSARVDVESAPISQGGEWKIKEWTIPDYSGTPQRNLINKKAPGFQLRDRTGDLYSSAKMFGTKVVLIYFFDASFAFCKKDLDEIALLYQDHSDQFVPVAICIAAKGNRRVTAENFLRTKVYDFPVVFDTTGVAAQYFVSDAVPMWVLIDRKGNVRYIKRGTWNMLPLYKRIDYLQRED
ncbi:MAG: redoxin domain-containing protein [Firmicutes bacterium]|nr:redoxin domain-containing protein [Bacillota bacterium]